MKEYINYKELSKLNLRDIEQLQNKRFKATVQYLLPHVPAYKKIFKEYDVEFSDVNSVHDWRHNSLPLIKKYYFIKNPEEFLVKINEKEVVRMHYEFLRKINFWQGIKFLLKTLIHFGNIKDELKDYYFPKMPLFSGGTEYGIPSQVFITQKQKQNLSEIIQIIYEILKDKYLKEPSVGMNLFPYGPHLGWHAAHMALDLCADLNLSTAAGGAIPTERLIAIAKKAKPNIFTGMGEYFKNRFLEVAIKEKIKLAQQLLFINGATKLYEGDKEKIKNKTKKLGTKTTHVLDLYAASELKEALFPECTENSGFHEIAPLSNILKVVEIVRGNENFVTEWAFKKDEKGGCATVWNIDGAGTLLEGYVIGDIFDSIKNAKCHNCGLNTRRIFNINRIRDVEAQFKVTGMIEEKVKGARINLSAVRDAVLKIPEVEECQVVLKTKPTELIVNIISKNSSAIQKAQHALRFLEVKPKFKRLSSLDQLVSKKLKFEGIVII